MKREWEFPVTMNPTDFGRQMQIIIFANPYVVFQFQRVEEKIVVSCGVNDNVETDTK